uniref:S-acyltransferase n=1 Tax=Aegilops tauschii subsp. strangulata TaxID=200361 RepID=A0A453SB35_AEGTS
MNRWVRRSYLEQWNSSVQLDPMLPFAFTSLEDIVSPHATDDQDISYCPICDCEVSVKLRSKHCKTCDRCVDGFDHHCRWLNNCIGRRNYAAFIMLMLFVLLMLVIEGGTAAAVFIRCFIDSKGLKTEMEHRLHVRLPKGAHAALSMVFVIFTLYSTAALGQLFFFHVLLIRKSTRKLSIRIDEKEANDATRRKDDVSINPWTLITMNKDKAMAAAERARERIRQKLPSTPGEKIHHDREGEPGEKNQHDREGDRACPHKELAVRITNCKVVEPKKTVLRVIVTQTSEVQGQLRLETNRGVKRA